MIYFLHDDVSKAVKVGCSVNPRQRASELQVGNANRFDLLGAMPGDVASEQRVRDLFAAEHARGEWVRATDEVLRAVHWLLRAADFRRSMSLLDRGRPIRGRRRASKWLAELTALRERMNRAGWAPTDPLYQRVRSAESELWEYFAAQENSKQATLDRDIAVAAATG